MYTNDELFEAIALGHLDANNTMTEMEIGEALLMLENMELSEIQRKDKDISDAEKFSRLQEVFLLNQKYKLGQGVDLPRFDVCERVDLHGEMHKVNGYHTEMMIRETKTETMLRKIMKKYPDMPMTELFKQHCRVFTYRAHNLKGELAVWRATNDKARGISAAERRTTEISMANEEFGRFVNRITDGINLSAEEESFARLINAGKSRAKTTTSVVRVVASLVGCDKTVKKACQDGSYYLGKTGSDVNANKIAAIESLMESQGLHKLVSDFVYWGEKIEATASFLLDTAWGGEKSDMKVSNNLTRAVPAIGACMRNASLAAEAFRIIQSGRIEINRLVELWNGVLDKKYSDHKDVKKDPRTAIGASSKQASSFHVGVATYLAFFRAVKAEVKNPKGV